MRKPFSIACALLLQCSGPAAVDDAGVDAAIDQASDVKPDAFDASADVGDAAVDVVDEDAFEAAVPLCDPNKPFGTPVEISELNSVGDLGLPRLTNNELTMYFDAEENGGDAGLTWSGGEDIVRATRASMTSPFTNFTVLSPIDTANNEMHPSPTGNDLGLVFTGGPLGGPDDLYLATRANTTSPFGTPSLLSISTSDEDWYPYILPNALTIYYSTGPTFTKLTRATRAATSDPFTVDTSSVLAKVNVFNATVDAPAVTPDDLTLFSTRDSGNNTGYDIFVSTRPNTTAQFSTPAIVSVSTSYSDRAGFISDDGCRLYISSDRTGPSRIYVATRPL